MKSLIIEGSSSENFLGITIDSNFTFEKYLNELCRKGNLKRQLKCSYEMHQIHEYKKRRLIFKAFIISQFNYCPLVWMFLTNESNK